MVRGVATETAPTIMPIASKVQIRDRGIAPHLALIAVQLIFGTWPIVGKVALRAMSSSGLVAFRVAGAAIVFLLLQGKLGELRKLPARDLALLTISSMLGIAINQLLFVKGLSLTTAINSVLLGTTIPVFTLVVSTVSYTHLTLPTSDLV